MNAEALLSLHSCLKVKLSWKFVTFSQNEARGAYTRLIEPTIGLRSSSAPVCAERSVFADFTCILYNQESLPSARASLPAFLTHWLSSLSLWGQKLCLETVMSPWAFNSSYMQCSHWGHLIRLTSTSALGTDCATRSLGESIILRLMWPWHPQPPIYLRVEGFSSSSPFLSHLKDCVFSFFTDIAY